MSDRERELFELRVIAVSTHTALAKPHSETSGAAIVDRADELLARLEAQVIRDGGDESVLAAIEHERIRIHN